MERPTRALHINCATRTISPVTITGLGDMQRLVGGYIETAVDLPNGDRIYVDEEGLLKNGTHGFVVSPAATLYPLANGGRFLGHGLLVGPCDAEGETTDALTSPEALAALVAFFHWA